MFIQEDPPAQHKSALLILNRDSSNSTETDDSLPPNSVEPEHQGHNSEQEETCKSLLNSLTLEDGLCLHQNGTGDHVQLQDGEVEPDLPAVGDTGNALDKTDCSQWRVEGDSVAFSAPSCGNQREEADIELRVISAKQGVASQPDKEKQEEQEACQKSSETEKDYNTESGILELRDMGHAQSQGLLPAETGQPSQREVESEGSTDVSWRGDLPEEREGETSSNQEIDSYSSALSSHDLEENSQHNGKTDPQLPTECSEGIDEAKLTLIQVNSEVTLSVRKDDTVIPDGVDKPHGLLETKTGNLSEHTKGNTESAFDLVADDVSVKPNSGLSVLEGNLLESLSLRPNMAPGPVHKVQQGLSPVPETSSHVGPAVESFFETTESFQQPNQSTQLSETALECQDVSLNDSTCDINAIAGVSVDISAEVSLCQNEGCPPDGIKERVTSSERIQDLKELMEEPESVLDIVVSDLDDKSQPFEESSLLINSECFSRGDLQNDMSTVQSSEHTGGDINVGMLLGEEEAAEKIEQPDSLPKQVEQIPEEYTGDTTNENKKIEPEEQSILLPTLQRESGFKDVVTEEPVQEREIDSTSEETISDLPDPSEITNNDCVESNAHSQLSESSKESANTSSEPAECLNDLDLSCALPQTEIEGSRTSGTPFIDGVTICAEILIEDKGVDMATNMSETAISEDGLSSPMDTTSGSALESSSMSDPLDASSSTAELTSPLDINSGLHQDLEHTSPVDIDNGLPEELPPLDTPDCLNGLHQDSLDSLMEHSGTLQQCAEELCADLITGNAIYFYPSGDDRIDTIILVCLIILNNIMLL